MTNYKKIADYRLKALLKSMQQAKKEALAKLGPKFAKMLKDSVQTGLNSVTEFDEKDIRVDSYNNAVSGATFYVTATHLPTGRQVKTSGKSPYRTKREAMDKLRDLVLPQQKP